MNFIKQILSDEKGVGSATRTGLMIGIAVFSIIMLALTYATVHVMMQTGYDGRNPDGGLLVALGGIFATLCTGGYLIHKGFQSSIDKAEIKASSEPSPINIPNADKVSVSTEGGDVNVSKSAS